MIRWVVVFKPIVVKSEYLSRMNVTQSNEQDMDRAINDVTRASHVLQ